MQDVVSNIKKKSKEASYTMIMALNDVFEGKSKRQIMKLRRLQAHQVEALARIRSAIRSAESVGEITELKISENDKNIIRSWMIDDCSGMNILYNPKDGTIQWVKPVENVVEEQNDNNITEIVKADVKPKSVDKKVNTDTSKRKPRQRITKEKEQKVIVLLVQGKLNQSEIAELTGVSRSSVSKINVKYNNAITLMKNSDTDDVAAKNEEPTKEVITCDKPYDGLKLINIHSCVKVGLVAERHDMPVDDFIFDKITNSMMFDYDKLERICRQYIQNNIAFDENGIAQQYLSVYVTGLQCVLSSIIKVTNEMKVNLILRHYDKTTDSYKFQVIWNCFGANIIPEAFLSVFNNSKNSYTYNCTLEEIMDAGKCYKICKVYYRDTRFKDIDYSETILTKDINDAFAIFKQHINDANIGDKNVIIYINEYEYSEKINEFIFSKESNFTIKFESKKK
jgi:predicted XRE-type DNA-binding protein